ncbi:MAG: Flp family type IVb pilin [Candidatus Nealsonbacteria bacterium]|nr:Flp family type IVb pilin [Candidatus Nealsonbacteria bacterium]
MQWIKAILRDEDATTAVEYAVMLALILMVAIGAVSMLGTESGGLWGGIESDLNTAGFGS